MPLFQDMKFGYDFKNLITADFWKKHIIQDTVATMVWIMAASAAGSSAFAWGLSYWMVRVMFNGDDHTGMMNANCNFIDFLKGKNDPFTWAFALLFQVLGGMLSFHVIDLLGATKATTVGVPVGDIATAAWATFWFGREFWGVFFFELMVNKHSNKKVPSTLFAVLMMAAAFYLGGDSFGLFPAHGFHTGIGAFISGGAWAMVFVQMLGSFACSLVCEYVWDWVF